LIQSVEMHRIHGPVPRLPAFAAAYARKMTFDFIDLASQLERVHNRRLAFRPAALSDAWPLYEATKNPLFNKHLMWPQPKEEIEVLRRMDAITSAARQGRLAAMSVVLKTTGEWVSLFRFQPHAANAKLVEMGIWTLDKFWHGRYSLEMTRICIDAAFEVSDFPALLGAAAAENRSSCHLMTAVGMRPTSLVTRITEMGTKVPLQEFEITRHEWSSRVKRGPSFDMFRPNDPPSGSVPKMPKSFATGTAESVNLQPAMA
jgi:RimJ/RimL family protein N-acetyltransferase